MIKKNRVSIAFMALSIILISIGIFREEYTVVFRKAVNICLECIGVG